LVFDIAGGVLQRAARKRTADGELHTGERARIDTLVESDNHAQELRL